MTADQIAPVVQTVTVRADVDVAFALFTDRIRDWWPLATHTPSDSLSQTLAFEDGHLVETQADGTRETWGSVAEWSPPRRLAFDWHPGGGPTSQIAVDFEDVVDGTRVVLTHTGWEAYGDRAQSVRDNYEGPRAWPLVLDLFEARADGAKVAQPGYDVAPLRAGYEAIAVALAEGPFGEPPTGEWTAAQVAGHVATNAEAMCQVVDGVRTGRTVRLHGPDDHLPEAVDRYRGQPFGDIATAVRIAGAALAARCAALGEADLDTAVPVYIEHHGEPVMDGDWPIGPMLGAQVAVHLPAHVEQIRDLRTEPGATSGEAAQIPEPDREPPGLGGRPPKPEWETPIGRPNSRFRWSTTQTPAPAPAAPAAPASAAPAPAAAPAPDAAPEPEPTAPSAPGSQALGD